MENTIDWTVDTTPDYTQLISFLSVRYEININNFITVHRYEEGTRYFHNDLEIDVDDETDLLYDTSFPTEAEAKTPPQVTESHFEMSKEDTECCICFETITANQFCKLNCEHTFCCDCIETILKKTQHKPKCYCPLCRKCIESIKVQKKEYKDSMEQYLS